MDSIHHTHRVMTTNPVFNWSCPYGPHFAYVLVSVCFCLCVRVCVSVCCRPSTRWPGTTRGSSLCAATLTAPWPHGMYESPPSLSRPSHHMVGTHCMHARINIYIYTCTHARANAKTHAHSPHGSKCTCTCRHTITCIHIHTYHTPHATHEELLSS